MGDMMNKYFLSQLIYDRFKLYSDIKVMTKTMEKLRKEVKSKDISQPGLERVLSRNVTRILKNL